MVWTILTPGEISELSDIKEFIAKIQHLRRLYLERVFTFTPSHNGVINRGRSGPNSTWHKMYISLDCDTLNKCSTTSIIHDDNSRMRFADNWPLLASQIAQPPNNWNLGIQSEIWRRRTCWSRMDIGRRIIIQVLIFGGRCLGS